MGYQLRPDGSMVWVPDPQPTPGIGPFSFPRQDDFPFFGFEYNGEGQLGGDAGGIAGEAGAAAEAMPPQLQYSPEMFGVGGSPPVATSGPPVTLFTPEAIPTPPPRGVDPAHQAREDYIRERNARLGPMFDRLEQSLPRDPSQNPWWQRLGGVFGAIAARPSLAEAGVATGAYLDDEARRRMELSEALMNIGLGREGLEGDLSEADAAQLSAVFGAEEGTRRDAYGAEAANVGQRNQAGQYNAERQDASGAAQWSVNQENARAGWQAQQALAQAEYLQAQEDLRRQLLTAAQTGNIDAYGSLFGRLPEDMQGAQIERARLGALETIITEAGTRTHRRMEQLAGRDLPTPPSNIRNSPRELARWYSQNGVPLNHPDVENAFPGFGGE